MNDRTGIFSGEDPIALVRAWLAEADRSEPNDPNAIALASVDAQGMPDVRMVLLKDIDGQGTDGSFVFYTNYDSAKGQQIAASGKAAFALHWKSLRRQIRVRGLVTQEDGPQADAYYASRALQSRLGAWASPQSRSLRDRAQLEAALADQTARQGDAPQRPPHWGGLRITPLMIEFWADGPFRLHDRFAWTRDTADADWTVTRLAP